MIAWTVADGVAPKLVRKPSAIIRSVISMERSGVVDSPRILSIASRHVKSLAIAAPGIRPSMDLAASGQPTGLLLDQVAPVCLSGVPRLTHCELPGPTGA